MKQNGDYNTSTKTQQFQDTNGNKKADYKMEIVWGNVWKFALLHAFAVVGMLMLPHASRATIIYLLICFVNGALGITAGAHRLWAHRSYKVVRPLKLYLIWANLTAAQNSIFVWVRDHRTHHKFSETDADPHNAKRGFFFAHMGWLMAKKHPDVLMKGAKIDMSDLKNDPDVMFQHRNYVPLTIAMCFVLPTVIPVVFWNESIFIAYFVAIFRYVISLHATWLVNSAAHLWGDKPYDININPAENKMVSLLAFGEGFHNYHHTFPQDYSVSEWRYSLNLTTLWIDVMAFCGFVHGRNSIPKSMVLKRIERTGPGTQVKSRAVVDEEEKDF